MNSGEDQLTDLEPMLSRPLMSKVWSRLLLSILTVVSLVSIIIVHLSMKRAFPNDDFRIMEGTFKTVVACVVSLPLMGVLAAVILSLIPLKRYSFKQRYWHITLVVICIFQLCFFMTTLMLFTQHK